MNNDAITVVGRLAGDPALKSVNGDRVAEFRVACSVRRKEGDAWIDAHTNWFGVEAWGAFADHVVASLRQGDLVIVTGKLRIEQWESGEKRGTSVKIRAEHVGHSLRFAASMKDRSAASREHGNDQAHGFVPAPDEHRAPGEQGFVPAPGEQHVPAEPLQDHWGTRQPTGVLHA